MHKTVQLSIGDLNQHLLCVLCSGYLVDATTIIECLHSFCRSCIVRYLETSKYCPICDVQIHKTKPLHNIRSDKTLQDIVYKLVPGLFTAEMKQRRAFYADHPDQAKRLKNREDLGRVDESRRIYTEDEKLSICLHHCIRLPPYHNGSSFSGKPCRDTSAKGEEMRYLLCPAAMTVGLVKKFIRLKFELTANYQIEVFHSDESLKDDYTLIDVAFIYSWRMSEPLKLYYIVFDRTKFILDHGGTESDSSLLTDPGGGALYRRKKLKGRRHKLASNEDSDSPSESYCMATTPNYVLRPVEAAKPKRQVQEADQGKQSEALTPAAAVECKLQNESEADRAEAMTTAENPAEYSATEDSGTDFTKDETVKDGKVDNANCVEEITSAAVSMQTQEDDDEEDIPLALLKKKLTEKQVLPPDAAKQETGHSDGSCDQSHEEKGASDSDTTSYDVHSGVEENNLFSDLEENTNEATAISDCVDHVRAPAEKGVSISRVVSCEADTESVDYKITINESFDEDEQETGCQESGKSHVAERVEQTVEPSASVLKKVHTSRTGTNANSASSVSPNNKTIDITTDVTTEIPHTDITTCIRPPDTTTKIPHADITTYMQPPDTTTKIPQTLVSSSGLLYSSKSTVNTPRCTVTYSVAQNYNGNRLPVSSALVKSLNPQDIISVTSSNGTTAQHPVNNNYKLLESKGPCVSLPGPVCTSAQSSPISIFPDTKPTHLGMLLGQENHAVTSSVITHQIGSNGLQCSSNGLAACDIQPLYSQINHSYPAADGQLKKEVLHIKKTGALLGCQNAAISAGAKVKQQTMSLATELLSQFGADVLQSINPSQKVETIVEGIKRKRGRPPKDKTKLLAQIKAQQSPAKLPRLLPKGMNGQTGQFYNPHVHSHHHPGATASNSGLQTHGHIQGSQLCPTVSSSTNMGHAIQQYACSIGSLNGLPVFNTNPGMMNLSHLQNSRMMATATNPSPYLQTVGNGVFQATGQHGGVAASLVRPINGQFQNVLLSPNRAAALNTHPTMHPSMDVKKIAPPRPGLSNHSNQCIQEPIMPITIAPKMEKVEQ